MALNKRTGIIAGGVAAVAAVATATFMLVSGPIRVAPTDDLQAAINSAPCGSVIELQAGQTYSVSLTLPKKDCTDYTTIQSSRASELAEGVRINPATQSALLVKLQRDPAAVAEPVIKTALGANHYKFIGVEIATQKETDVVYDLVRLGDGKQAQTTLASVAHDLIIDRSWIHGFSTQDVQRGVSMQCGECSVLNSYITDIHMVGIEAQGIAGWNGPGPFHIINNHIEASTQNILFGGADSASAELAPANAEIRRNHLFKPLSWKVGHPTYAGKHWTIKNIFELKSMKGAVIDGNVFENNWTDGQDGKPILFTVRNQECGAPWSTIQRVQFTNNLVKNAEGGLNFLGKDNEAESSYGKCPAGTGGSVQGSDALVANNVFDQITGSFVTINGFANVHVENNTDLQTCSSGCNTITFYGEQSIGYVHRGNVHDEKAYGLFGDGGLAGQVALDHYAPGAVVTGNYIAKPYNPWPSGNTALQSLTITSDYRTPYAGAGADIDKLLVAQAGGGVSQPSPTASVSVSPSPTSTATPVATPTPTTTPTPTPTPITTPLPTPSPSPTAKPSPTPTTCATTSWPSSIPGQNAKMAEQRAVGCYPVERTASGMRYVRR